MTRGTEGRGLLFLSLTALSLYIASRCCSTALTAMIAHAGGHYGVTLRYLATCCPFFHVIEWLANVLIRTLCGIRVSLY